MLIKLQLSMIFLFSNLWRFFSLNGPRMWVGKRWSPHSEDSSLSTVQVPECKSTTMGFRFLDTRKPDLPLESLLFLCPRTDQISGAFFFSWRLPELVGTCWRPRRVYFAVSFVRLTQAEFFPVQTIKETGHLLCLANNRDANRFRFLFWRLSSNSSSVNPRGSWTPPPPLAVPSYGKLFYRRFQWIYHEKIGAKTQKFSGPPPAAKRTIDFRSFWRIF